MLGEYLRNNRSSNRPIRPAISKANNEQRCHFNNSSSFIRIRREGGRKARHDQKSESLDGKSSEKKTSPPKALDSKSIDQNNEKLKNGLDPVDR
jgi:hypothetical protein